MSSVVLNGVFSFEGKDYGPFLVRHGECVVRQWPNSTVPFVESKLRELVSAHEGFVNLDYIGRSEGPAKERLTEVLKGFETESLLPMLEKLDECDVFDGLGIKYSMLLLLAQKMRTCRSLICLFSGVDPLGRRCMTGFARVNVGNRAILVLDPFFGGEIR